MGSLRPAWGTPGETAAPSGNPATAPAVSGLAEEGPRDIGQGGARDGRRGGWDEGPLVGSGHGEGLQGVGRSLRSQAGEGGQQDEEAPSLR
eukprot:CAMPEP_0117736238 /NCGR_PEP_ID=MMETSP0947-20121206/1805_1 /TAXON_ID=44440 /ORGANISM="Chattonella subsalsa, Strain CCMP2191" /LENGTH=90 /DNA_ID=CAMNT_0005551479 /DNA_START=871 /DNA_END=1142 /DNA_ORIENTATION=-